MSKADYSALLQAVLSTSEFADWKEVSDGKYRNFKNSSNPSIELSTFGLFDHKAGTQLESLEHLARRLKLKPPKIDYSSIQPNARDEFDSLEGGFNIKPPPPENDSQQNQTPDQTVKLVKKQMSREDTDEVIERLFGPASQDARAPGSLWQKYSKEKLWKYFVGTRKCILESNKESQRKDFLKVMLQLQAYFTSWTQVATGKHIHEIRIPLRNESGELVQLMRIEVDEEFRKLSKKVLFKQDSPRACFFGHINARELIITEGIEDALSLAFNLDRGLLYRYCVIGGKNGFQKLDTLLKVKLEHSDIQKISIICDNDKKEEGLQASMQLGSELELANRAVPIERLMPTEVGLDANKILTEHGAETLRTWFGSNNENQEGFQKVDFKTEVNRLAEEERQMEMLSKGKPSEYNLISNTLTQSAAAQLFVGKFKDIVRITEDNRWWCYDQDRCIWTNEHAESVVLALATGLSFDYRKIFLHRQSSLSDAEQKEWKNFIKSIGQSIFASGVLRLVAGDPAIRCMVSDFDNDPNIINLRNGILLLNQDGTTELVPHNSKYMCSLQAGVSYRPGGRAPEKFLKFLSEVSALQNPEEGDPIEDQEMISYWQRVCGYLITGEATEKMLFFCTGEGGDNGKSMLSNVLQGILGTYATTSSPESFMESRLGVGGSNASPDIAELAGKRLVVAAELQSRMSFNEALIKTITGNEEIRARFLHKNFFKFRPRFKLLFHGNSKPKINGTDPAIWRRQQIIPFDITIPKEKQIQNIDKILLEEEGDLIFQWILEGYRLWREMGINSPKRVQFEVSSYRAESDSFATFLEERCTTLGAMESRTGSRTRDMKVKVSELRLAYVAWCGQCRITPQNAHPNRFGRMVMNAGFSISTLRTGKYVLGIEIKSEWSEDLEIDSEDEDSAPSPTSSIWNDDLN